jgi:hypothetical protein
MIEKIIFKCGCKLEYKDKKLISRERCNKEECISIFPEIKLNEDSLKEKIS